MELVLYLLVLGASFEMLLYFSFLWRMVVLRLTLSMSAVACTLFAFVALAIYAPSLATALLLFIALYRVANQYRILKGRMHGRYMYVVTTRTSLSLIGVQLLIGLLWELYTRNYIHIETSLYIVAVIQLVVALIILVSTLRRLDRTRAVPAANAPTSSELPSVTIAIPARNETDDLQDCLRTVVETDYPKLEILVLDDCSQLKRTPEIIREFAHAGVRFVKGETPAENWLAKNQAYDKLLREANGEVIVFCGVDVRLDPDSIRQLVTVMHDRNKRMVSVLPQRLFSRAIQYSFIQAARYMWELSPPRRLIRRPPVVSSCWAIYRKDALQFGGFKAVSRAILPELFFAKKLLNVDGYSFLRANENLAIYSAKSHQAQRATALRVRYPQLHKRPEMVLLFTVLMMMIFVLPYIMLPLAIINELSAAYIAIIITGIWCNLIAYFLVAKTTGVVSWYLAPVMIVPTIVVDVLLMNYSFIKYEFSEVIWKGRNICVPVMHVTPALPKV